MSLAQLKTDLRAHLADQQQNAVADILIQIKAAPYAYDKVLYASVQSSMSPLGLSLMAAQIVQSTRALINSLTEQTPAAQSEYEQPARTDLKNLIAQGNLKHALDEFGSRIQDTSHTEMKNNILLLLARYNNNENTHRNQLITGEAHRLEFNKIGAALLYYIDEFA